MSRLRADDVIPLGRVTRNFCDSDPPEGRDGAHLHASRRLPPSSMADISAPPVVPPLAAPPLGVDPSQAVQPIVAPVPVDAAAAVAVPAAPAEPEHVSETLYIQNLNEKIKIPVMKASLRGLFKSYGEVLDVVAHANLRMRGQAFVSFASADIAQKALKEVRGFPLYSKPMVRQGVLLQARMVLMPGVANIICTDTLRCSGEEAGSY